MTEQQIDRDRLRKLADAATPGPWENTRHGVQQSIDAATQVGEYRYEGDGIVPEEYVREADAEFIAAARTAVPALLDALAAAEARATRAEAQSAIRGRAVVIYRDRARKAEAGRDEWRQTALDERGAALDALEQIKVRDARIKAVEDALSYADMGETLVTRSRIRRALEGDA